ncbi:hemerythrin domain-containing protein [Gordonia paraffinivorans]|uniref:hemerythrin domain-containing protein n=1 Tax=Gordonia paraffinivorans TaxID=175628 RepID=UPI00215A5A2D|nr:hemerythrin domain-containing protein [Gordonia paraffinivorans]
MLWPLLQVRAAPSTALVETMQHQHGVVDSRTEAIREHEAAWTQDPTPAGGERLAHLVEDLASALFEHLELEEREILPLVTCHIAVDEWRKLFEHGKDTMTPRQLPLMFGAVLEDADPDERARMLGQFPIPIASCAPSARGSTAATSGECAPREFLCQATDVGLGRGAAGMPTPPGRVTVTSRLPSDRSAAMH